MGICISVYTCTAVEEEDSHHVATTTSPPHRSRSNRASSSLWGALLERLISLAWSRTWIRSCGDVDVCSASWLAEVMLVFLAASSRRAWPIARSERRWRRDSVMRWSVEDYIRSNKTTDQGEYVRFCDNANESRPSCHMNYGKQSNLHILQVARSYICSSSAIRFSSSSSRWNSRVQGVRILIVLLELDGVAVFVLLLESFEDERRRDRDALVADVEAVASDGRRKSGSVSL